MTHLNGAGAFPELGSVRPDHAAAVAEARRMVEGTTLSQHAIAQQLRVSDSTVSLWKKRWGWMRPEGSPVAPPEFAGRDTAKAAEKRRDVLVGRLYRVFDRQLMDVESRAADAVAVTEEKDARTLGTLARTLGTLIALEAGGEREDGAPADEPERYDPDEVRARLAARLAGLREEGDD
ncbi:MAG TPA: hypothetical protein VHA70_10335 [Bauldia sp.]|nr:hypothetical protein [Bauldia sp.]